MPIAPATMLAAPGEITDMIITAIMILFLPSSTRRLCFISLALDVTVIDAITSSFSKMIR